MRLVRQCAKSLLSACVPRRRLIVRGPRSKNVRPKLALTFDDGPHPEYTPRLLDLLEDLDLRATFFVIGQKAEAHPAMIQRMVAFGHDVANHTYTHSEPRITTPQRFLEEIRQTDRLLSQLTGKVTSLVRPPKGELNLSKLFGIWRDSKTIALWNIDPKDFCMTGCDEMKIWCEKYQPADGDILLMHDIHPYALVAIKTLHERGIFDRFETTTIHQWIS